MIFDVPGIQALAHECAREVATEALVPLVMTESHGDALQINVNKGPRVRAATVAAGAAIVRRYMAAGYTVDVGLAQINSANFARLGVTVEEAFEPCTNLRLASTVLQQSYDLATRYYTGLDAISVTYSLYNTGTLTRGLRNGYVDKVWAAATSMGTIDARPAPPAGAGMVASVGSAQSVRPAPRRDDWVVGQMAPDTVQVFK